MDFIVDTYSSDDSSIKIVTYKFAYIFDAIKCMYDNVASMRAYKDVQKIRFLHHGFTVFVIKLENDEVVFKSYHNKLPE